MKKNIISFMILGAAFALSACSALKVQDIDNKPIQNIDAKERYLVTAINSDIQTIDVHKTSKDYMVPLNIFDRLVEVEVQEDNSTRIVPSLAEDWDISVDGRVYTFHLREGVKFHNGEIFNAEDVEYSLNRILTAKQAVNGDFVAYIDGADELMSGAKSSLRGVKIIDDFTVEITLKQAYAGFLACLSSSPVCILDKTTTEEAGDDFGIVPEVTVGTGPYIFKEWKVNDSITLVRNDEYWKGKADALGALIKIVPDTETQNMMYRNGDIDILDLDYMADYIDTYKAEFSDKLVSVPRVGITYFTFNFNNEALSDVNVRKAVSMAIDRQAIIDSLWSGVAKLENGIYPKGLIAYNPDIEAIEYNPQKAKELLDKAGYAQGFDLEISADSSASDTVNSCLEIIAAQLQEIGINAQIKNYDQATWLATRKDGSLGSFMATWTADYNDPDNFIYTFYGNKNNTKLRSINYNNEEVMQRVEAARNIADTDERINEYRELEKQIVSVDHAWLPMFAREHYFALSDKVESFVPNWAGISDIQFFNIKLK